MRRCLYYVLVWVSLQVLVSVRMGCPFSLGHPLLGLGFRVWGLGFRVWGLGFGVWGLGSFMG